MNCTKNWSLLNGAVKLFSPQPWITRTERRGMLLRSGMLSILWLGKYRSWIVLLAGPLLMAEIPSSIEEMAVFTLKEYVSEVSFGQVARPFGNSVSSVQAKISTSVNAVSPDMSAGNVFIGLKAMVICSRFFSWLISSGRETMSVALTSGLYITGIRSLKLFTPGFTGSPAISKDCWSSLEKRERGSRVPMVSLLSASWSSGVK